MAAVAIKPTTRLRAIFFSMGLAAAGGTYAYMQRVVWRGTAQVAREGYGTLPEAQQDAPEPLFGPKARAVVARRWNEAVDGTLGALARELARRGI